MHLQRLSEIFFEEPVAIPTPSRTPHAPAWRTPACATDDSGTVTRHLAPLLESLCRREMRRCLEPGEALADAIELRIERGQPTVGARLRVGGWVEQIADRSATFRLRAHGVEGIVLEATLKLELAAGDTADAAFRDAVPTPHSSSAPTARGQGRRSVDGPVYIGARTCAWLP